MEGYYNLLFRRFEDFESLISNNKIGFIVASPLSRGLLSGKDYDNFKFSKSDIRKRWQKGQAQYEWYANQKRKISKLEEFSNNSKIPLTNIS